MKVYNSILVVTLIIGFTGCGEVVRSDSDSRIRKDANVSRSTSESDNNSPERQTDSTQNGDGAIDSQIISQLPIGTSMFNLNIPAECCLAVPGKVFLRQCVDFDSNKCIIVK